MRWAAMASASLLALGCSGSTESVAVKGKVEVAGVWHDCASRLELADDASFELDRLIHGCSESGSYALHGEVLTLDFKESSCKEPSSQRVAEVVRLPDRLVLVSSESVDTLYADGVPRQRYELTGNGSGPPANGTSIVRLVGEPGSPGSSRCYFSADGACGGFLSCGGSVDVWQLDGAAFVGKLGCGGSCPCAALLEGQAAGDGSISGSFSGLDCGASHSGTFVAQPVSD
jgi:hypothetical protein